ncbi:MarR family transcriptional regulator [uncultured Clostridium sp.]|jgi:DNA-binding MarR family transcriptional regulator|uniref:MarR family winged helix-turn-helix transcriptional regulator n=1 Tax=uncultured Clostridium sp. TaxID=59620 RepID=UPI00260CF52E|nr:MarR family transcriptional regulator [uncultured Clostridium sp.]
MNMDEFKICLYIKEFNTIINTEVSERLKHKGLTQSQITAIKFVAHKHKITLTELSEKMSIKKSTCSGIVDRLEAIDVFERIKDENDKRISYIQFSEKGKTLAFEIKDDMNGVFADIFKDVPKETLDLVGTKLEEIIEIIKK